MQQQAEPLFGRIHPARQRAKVDVRLLGAQGVLVEPVGDFAKVAAKACALAFQRLPLRQAVQGGDERVESRRPRTRDAASARILVKRLAPRIEAAPGRFPRGDRATQASALVRRASRRAEGRRQRGQDFLQTCRRRATAPRPPPRRRRRPRRTRRPPRCLRCCAPRAPSSGAAGRPIARPRAPPRPLQAQRRRQDRFRPSRRATPTRFAPELRLPERQRRPPRSRRVRHVSSRSRYRASASTRHATRQGGFAPRDKPRRMADSPPRRARIPRAARPAPRAPLRPSRTQPRRRRAASPDRRGASGGFPRVRATAPSARARARRGRSRPTTRAIPHPLGRARPPQRPSPPRRVSARRAARPGLRAPPPVALRARCRPEPNRRACRRRATASARFRIARAARWPRRRAWLRACRIRPRAARARRPSPPASRPCASAARLASSASLASTDRRASASRPSAARCAAASSSARRAWRVRLASSGKASVASVSIPPPFGSSLAASSARARASPSHAARSRRNRSGIGGNLGDRGEPPLQQIRIDRVGARLAAQAVALGARAVAKRDGLAMLLVRSPAPLDQGPRPRHRRVGRRRREQRGVIRHAEAPRHFVQARLRGAARLHPPRQILRGLAHGAEPLAQCVDRLAFSQQRRVDAAARRSPLRPPPRPRRADRGLRSGPCRRRAPRANRRASARRPPAGPAKASSSRASPARPRELCARALRALPPRQRAARLVMLRLEVDLARARREHLILGGSSARRRSRSASRRRLLRLVMTYRARDRTPCRRDLRGVNSASASPRSLSRRRESAAEAGRTRRERLGEPAAGRKQRRAALAQRLRGQAEFALEGLASRPRPSARCSASSGDRLVPDVDERVLVALAAAQFQAAEPSASRKAPPTRSSAHLMREARRASAAGKPNRRSPIAAQRRRLAGLVGAQHDMERRVGAKVQRAIREIARKARASAAPASRLALPRENRAPARRARATASPGRRARISPRKSRRQFVRDAAP